MGGTAPSKNPLESCGRSTTFFAFFFAAPCGRGLDTLTGGGVATRCGTSTAAGGVDSGGAAGGTMPDFSEALELTRDLVEVLAREWG